MSGQIVRYVKQGGTGNGSTWETASGDFQAMINEASAGWNVYVAAGTYMPAAGQSFSMKNGVRIYGGFPATGSPGMESRNPAINTTILQGNGNRVLNNNNTDTNARLDGFTIQGGVLTGSESGAGIYNYQASPKIVNCIIRNNQAGNWGGGVYSIAGFCTFYNCLIYGNTASGGGGAFNHHDQSTYTNCTFAGNTATVNGGGIHLHESGSVTLINSICWGNDAAADGDEGYMTGSTALVVMTSIIANEAGDIYGNMTPAGNTSYSNPMFADAASNNYMLLFGSPAVNTGNNSSINGYATDLAGNARIYQGTIDKGAYELQEVTRYVRQGGTGNGLTWQTAAGSLQATINASSAGDKVYVAAGTYTPASGQSFSMKSDVKIYGGFPPSGNPAFSDRNWTANVAILQGNNARVVVNDNNGLTNTAILDGFTITNGSSGQGGGMFNHNVSPTLTNLIVKNNFASSEGGGLYFNGGTPVITNVSLLQNTVGSSGNDIRRGGGFYSWEASPSFTNVLVANNTIAGTGGFGGGLCFLNSSPSLLNVTVAGNSAATGPGFYSQNGAPQIKNSIVYGNAAAVNGGSPTWSNNIVQGSGGSAAWNGNFGTNNGNNLDTDPLFIDSANSDFRLSGASPARNAGNTSLFSNAATSNDLAGQPRLFSTSIDMGAYEHQSNPPAAQPQSFCSGTTVASLLPAGANIKWYNVASGGTALSANTVLTTGNYYVSQTLNGYESGRTATAITINALPATPVAAANQNFCSPTTVAGLIAQGTEIKWYSQASGGTALAAATVLSAGTYYASQTIGCESLRTPVNVTYNLPAAPVANAMILGTSATVANLSATGQNLKWYNTITGGTPLALTYPITTNTYYVSQTVDGCESPRTAVPVTVFTGPVMYVKKNSAGNGTSWGDAVGELAYALSSAKAINELMPGSIKQIWVSGGTYKPMLRADNLSGTNPFDRENTFLLIKDVKLYGGFAGSETSLVQRDLSLTDNAAILSGDYLANDTFDANGLPSAGLDDNAYHVLLALQNLGTAAIDGFSIRGGSADGPSWLVVNGVNVFRAQGGGMACFNATLSVSNTIFEKNYAATGGGVTMVNSSVDFTNITFRANYALYGGGLSSTSASILSIGNGTFQNNYGGYSGGGISCSTTAAIKSTVFKNNKSQSGGGFNSNAGTATMTGCLFYENLSTSSTNGGGAIYSQNAAITIINTTIAKNGAVNGGGLFIKNTAIIAKNAIVAGNTASAASTAGLAVSNATPVFTNSLVQPAGNLDTSWPAAYGTNAGGNVVTIDPQFTDAGTNDFRLFHSSPARNSGDTSFYPDAASSTDLAGYPRSVGASIDMGAYEHQAGAPQNVQPHMFCNTATVANLVATGTDIKWYNVATGGVPLAAATQLSTGNYYVSQTINGYESARTMSVVTINPLPEAPVAPASQSFCGYVTVASLTAEGTSLKWYSQESGGTALQPYEPLATGTYYVSQSDLCESMRTPVQVYAYPIPSAPVAPSRVFTQTATVAELSAEGDNIKWYSSASGGTALEPSQPLSPGSYFASQTVDGCESSRTEIKVYFAMSPTLFVKKDATGAGTSWDDAINELAHALKFAKQVNAIAPGTITQIWVARGTYKPIPSNTPFELVDNVELYGHFIGNETAVGQRDLNNPAGLTLLSGDINDNDTYDANDRPLETYGDNIHYVIYAGVPGGRASVDGFTVSNANYTGVHVVEMSIHIRNCIIKHNGDRGIFMTYSHGSELTNVKILSNKSFNYGTGICCYNSNGFKLTNVLMANNDSTYSGLAALLAGNMTDMEIVNCTFARNEGGANLSFLIYQSSVVMANTIVATPFQINDPITLSNVMVPADTWGFDIEGVIKADPLFTDPANLDFSLQQGSPAINAGNTSYFENAATSTDLAGNTRTDGSSIDLGAYEFKETCAITTTWNGNSWNNGTPTSYQYAAIIEGSYDSSENGEVTACSLTVNSGNVVIAEGGNFTVKGAVIVDNENATFTIQHNANLIQVNDVDNMGTINVIKESAPMYRLDYALWGSPVAGQKLKAFSPQTLDNRFYTYNPLSDGYSQVQAPTTTHFAEAKGYLIRVANNHPAYVSDDIAPTRWTGTFTGVPNNGNVDLNVIPGSDGVDGFNAISNPYPSSINIKAFFDANQNNLAANTPIYFWRKKNEAGTSSYCSLTLAGYNANTGNDFGDSSDGMFSNPNDSEDWVINSGQGFIVKAIGNTVVFRNDMRVAENNGQMFRTAQEVPDKSRLWLNISNAEGAFGQTMIAYTPATTLGLDYGWDGQALTDGDIAIYSLAGESKLGIQARPAFDAADEVPMEIKVTTAGHYSISLDHFDGVFTDGQEIYLRDNDLGGTHNLQTPYQFTTEPGSITGRFDVVYAEALGTDFPAFDSNNIIVYKQGNAINISTGNIDMKAVAVYDIRGSLLYSVDNINGSSTAITTLQSEEQMLIVQVTTISGDKASRKIVF